MTTDSFRNPFSGINAAHLDEQAILQYWCSPFAYRFFAEIKQNDIYKDPNNIVLMGGRSTGKTMFLRYWSFPVQIKLANGNKRNLGKKIIDFFKDNGGLGYYIRIDGPVLRSFSESALSNDGWNAIFSHYFELIVARSYIESLKAINDEAELPEKEMVILVKKIAALLGNNRLKTLDEILHDLDSNIALVDAYRGEYPFSGKKFRPKTGFAAQSLSFGIPKLVKATLKQSMEGIRFILLIDEYENFLEHQQRVVNTLLKFTTPDIGIRIGMRLEGFRTLSTISNDDFVKEGREYRKVAFEEVLIKNKGYQEFLREVSRKRLEAVGVFKASGKTDIVDFLSKSEDLESEARQIAKKNPKRTIDTFAKRLPRGAASLLRYEKNPLLELLNVLWVFRGFSPEDTRDAMNKYLNKDTTDRAAQKYRMDYVDKYKLSLMFLLCSIYKKDKQYYSFNTFSFLSSGIIGNFMDLCRRSFQYAEFEDRHALITEGRLSVEHQTKAAIDISESEVQSIVRINEFGGMIYTLINNLGNFFRDFHRDERLKYPETNQFSVDLNTITDDNCQRAFREAIKWSSIQRKSRLQQAEAGKHLREIYTINRIYSPAFQISYRTRGGYSIPLTGDDIELLMKERNVNSRQFTPTTKEEHVSQQTNLELFEDL